MYRYLWALCFAGAAHAQESLPFYTTQYCNTAEYMFDEVSKYGETPLFTANSVTFDLESNPYPNGMMFFVNQDTGTFSILSFYPDGMSCMLAVGSSFEPFSR